MFINGFILSVFPFLFLVGNFCEHDESKDKRSMCVCSVGKDPLSVGKKNIDDTSIRYIYSVEENGEINARRISWGKSDGFQ